MPEYIDRSVFQDFASFKYFSFNWFAYSDYNGFWLSLSYFGDFNLSDIKLWFDNLAFGCWTLVTFYFGSFWQEADCVRLFRAI